MFDYPKALKSRILNFLGVFASAILFDSVFFLMVWLG